MEKYGYINQQKITCLKSTIETRNLYKVNIEQTKKM